MFSLITSTRARRQCALFLVLSIWLSFLTAFTQPSKSSSGDSGLDEANSTVNVSESQGTFVRKIQLVANDVVYSPQSKKLYATVPSSDRNYGNSIAVITPETGLVDKSVFMGSEPEKLAISNDGNTIYASLRGAGALRRFDVATHTAGAQFALGFRSFYGPYTASDVAIAPGNPNLVAVARQYLATSPSEAGVAVYDNGVQRPITGPGHIEGPDYLAFSSTQDTLYGGGYYYGLRTMTVDSSGITVAGKTSFDVGARIKFDNGLIYSSTGQVIDPKAGTLLGTFSGANSTAFAIDSAAGRAYYLVRDFSTGYTLKAFDLKTFVPVGTATIQGVVGDPYSMVRWGSNGLAVRTFSNELVLIQTGLIPSPDPVPSPTPIASPTPTPSPEVFPTFVRTVDAQVNDALYNPTNQRVYAAVPSSNGVTGNSIAEINPENGQILTSTFIGSEPSRLALSDNGQVLYTYLDGAKTVRRFDIAGNVAGSSVQIKDGGVLDLEVLPGSTDSFAIGRNTWSNPVSVYDNGVERPYTGGAVFTAYATSIEFGANSSTLYSYNSYSSGYDLVKYSLENGKVTPVENSQELIFGYLSDMKFSNGLLYSAGGRVVDPEAKTLAGTFTQSGTALAVDESLGKVFYAYGNGQGIELRAYDIHTYMPAGMTIIRGATGTPVRMVRWGENGLAICARAGFGGSGESAYNKLYLVQSTLVSKSSPIPTSVQFERDKNFVSEGSTVPGIKLIRTGDLSKATTVTVNATDGTAIKGKDYNLVETAVSFAPGEESKSVNLQILDDNVYEGSTGTFTLTLSNAQNAEIAAPATTLVSIYDNDSQPSVSVTVFNPQVTETDAGTSVLKIPVKLSNSSYQAVTVNYLTSSGTATAGSDFVATSGTLTFAPGTVAAEVEVPIIGDTLEEGNETFQFNLANPVNAWVYSPQTTITIVDNDGTGDIYVTQSVGSSTAKIGDEITYSFVVGNNGKTIVRSVVLTDQLALPLTFVSCSASVNGVCGGGGSTRTITFESIPAGGTVTATVVARVNARIRNGVGIANTGTVAHSTADPITSNNTSSTIITVQNSPSVIQMAEPTISYSEGGRVLNVTVYRGGNVFAASTVRYAALDGTATQRADYTMSSGTISFLPGQIAAVVPVIINEDLHVEGSETFRLKLSNPVAAELSEPTETAITLLDNDLVPATTNPLDDAQYYVQQHYYDFMNRLPDQGGWDYWKEQISSCGTDQVCIASRRVGVSAAFFIEAEFQDTGSYVYRMHKATYGQRPLYSDFITDRSRVIGGADLEQGKQAFAIDWVNRPEFLQKYPADLTGAEFVDGLLQTIFHGSGVDLSGKRQALVDDYAANQSRARVLRMVVDDPAFQKAEYNRAFVLMQYFGYLRRDPDPDGYNFWLDIIDNREKGNFRGMVCAFINSPEYQLRFSPVVTRNDKICPVVAAP